MVFIRLHTTSLVILLLAVALLPAIFASRSGAAGVLPVSDPKGLASEVSKAAESRQTLGMEFVRIPGGEFEMGSADGDADEKPVHRVRISEMQIGKSEVTQAQWAAVMGDNPSQLKGCDDCPVEKVSWNDVQEFVRKASAQTGLPLRLPTEAEWEYAARGSQQQQWAGTDSESEAGEYVWSKKNSENKVHQVCQKRPNAFGLCDMSGNVGEWVSDWYDEGYYATSPADDPTGPSAGSARVVRGGSWFANPWNARAADRYWFAPNRRYNTLGFRLVLAGDQR